ncbi:ferrous iron transport protein B [Moorella sp. Hama-1]|uniref:ferrous iron transport protein B n=1 Tax=Moorella sp. Hama-1 TaxID=2138101 RepID=UPI001F3708EB|nr:ferrous iron transport protein B [Moorella sp. Hama-1]BCV21635.1 ferrous iron transport protein B [Moorella sp. Hama-1]
MVVAAMAKPEREEIIALVGNPNSGKTSIFNDLTGARQHVGNWPGVTVEKKEGKLIYQGETYNIVDLPGTYSLGAYSEDELIARNFILFDKPEAVINVVDASNLERNLYLTIQLLEMGANIVVALNMVDEARARKIEINIPRLAQALGVPVVPTVATRSEGIKELVAMAASKARETPPQPLLMNYGPEIEAEINKLEQIIKFDPNLSAKYPARWLAIKLLEDDARLQTELQQSGARQVLEQAAKSNKHLGAVLGEEVEAIIADRRYGFINGLVREAVTRRQTLEERLTVSDKIDSIVTNRYLGLPIFILAMRAVFQFTFKLGEPMIGGVETAFAGLTGLVTGWLAALGAPGLLTSFIADGIIGGLGSVLVFIPPIFLLFLAISLLEDSGYMARAAYIMDRLMHTLGLHGKSFVPLLIGFGCNVPGIMATRTLESRKDRMITILINPLMSCTARLPVYVLFTGAFFTANQGWVIFSLYLLGIVLAIIMGKIFKTFLFKGETAPFVMELPPYRVPTLKGTLIHMWERGSSFVRKAGTVIVAAVVLIWVLSNLPLGVEYASQESLIGRLGTILAPIFKPAGFGTWQAAVALLFGILAKEVVVGTLGVLYGVEESGLTAAIAQSWTPLSAYAFMVMTLIYIPCVAAIGAIRRETNSWGWTAFAVGYSLVLGWVMAVLVFQAGKLLGLG